MKFQVEAELRLGIERYRMQKNGSWRKIKSSLSKNYPEFDREDSFSIDDFLTDNLEEIRPYVNLCGNIIFGGKTYTLNSQEGDLAELLTKTVYIHPRVHRLTKPRRFSRGELMEVIASGNDTQNNVLVLDLNGCFKLMDIFKAHDKLAPIAVRHESYMAGNGYVGFQAARNKIFIEKEYLSTLEGWVTHLMTGKLNVYQDIPAQKGEAELWREVDYLTEHLK